MENTTASSPSKVSSFNKKTLRIADILSVPDDTTESSQMNPTNSDKFSSPRRFVSRLFSRFKEKKKPESTDEKRRLDFTESEPTRMSCNSDSSECRTKETTFNQAIGYGLLYMMAASKNELNKMMDLRKQMETFLENAKEELKRDGTKPRPSVSSYISSSFDNDIQESSDSCSYPMAAITDETSYGLSESVTYMTSDHADSPQQDEQVGEIDQLVADLEAELELLQLQLDAERSSTYLQRHIEKGVVEDNAAASSLSSGEVIDPQDIGSVLHSGVPPYELERRLHEVLETRQQERIKELEAALKCVLRELHEKNLEISWWKDTAHLVSRNILQASGPDHPHDL